MDAFKAFNFDGDERWKAYLRTVELPGGDSASAMLKLKARWYKRTIDPDFDTTAVGSAPKASTGAAAGGATGPSTNTNTSSSAHSRPQPPPPPPPPQYGTYGTGGSSSSTYGGASAQRRLFLMHLAMLALGLFVVVPLLPFSRTAFTNLLRLTILTFAYKIYLQHGLPSFRPWSMAMAWLQRVMPTADFLQLLVALSFAAHPPVLLVAVPPLVLAAYHGAAYAAAHLAGNPLWQRYGSGLHAAMLRRQPDALLLNAFCEVATWLLLVVQVLTPARSLLTLLFYTQVLKLKLHVPDSAPQHRQVWRRLDEMTAPYRQRVPAVERLVQYAANWFSQFPGA